jgi:hypothetical protein
VRAAAVAARAAASNPANDRNHSTVFLVLGSHRERRVGITRRWTNCCSVFILISSLFPTSTFAQKQIDDEARSVTADFHGVLKRTGQLQTFGAGMCLGILKGLHYLSKDICIPPATSIGEIGDVVSQYFDGHIGKIENDFQESALDAMRSAWPCAGRKNI